MVIHEWHMTNPCKKVLPGVVQGVDFDDSKTVLDEAEGVAVAGAVADCTQTSEELNLSVC